MAFFIVLNLQGVWIDWASTMMRGGCMEPAPKAARDDIGDEEDDIVNTRFLIRT